MMEEGPVTNEIFILTSSVTLAYRILLKVNETNQNNIFNSNAINFENNNYCITSQNYWVMMCKFKNCNFKVTPR